MRTLTAAALIAAMAAAPAFAQAPAAAPAEAAAAPAAAPAADAAPGVFQVLRPTDKDLSCEQLSAETNTLNAMVMQTQQAAAEQQAKSARNRAIMGRLGGAALALGGQAAMMNGMFANPLVRGAMQAGNSMANSAASGGAVQATAATMTPQQQRMNHLLALYQAKAC